MELFHLHDWNVVFAPDGKDFQQIASAQQVARTMDNAQPTAVIYRTVRGWRYGIEGKAAHGAGHTMCSDGLCRALAELTGRADTMLPTCAASTRRCMASPDSNVIIRKYVEERRR